MAVIFASDGFELGNHDEWIAGLGTHEIADAATYNLTGDYCLRFNTWGYVYRDLPDIYTNLVLSFDINFESTGDDEDVCLFQDSDSNIIGSVKKNTSDQIEIYSGLYETLLDTGSTALSVSTKYNLEIRYTPLAAGGTFTVLLDSVEECSFTGATTNGASSVGRLRMGGGTLSSAAFEIDDISLEGDVYAEPVIGSAVDGDCVFPLLTAEGYQIAPVTGTLDATLPLLTLSARDVVRGSASMTLPRLTLQAAAGAKGSPSLPALTISASGTVPVHGSLSAELPALEAAGRSGARGGGDLPSLEISASGRTDLSGSLSLTLPQLTLSASGSVQVSGSLEATLPALQMSSTTILPVHGSLDTSMPPLQITASGGQGVLGSLSAGLPMFELTATGAMAAVGTLSATLPMLQLSGRIISSIEVVYPDGESLEDSAYAICVNAEHGAVSEYFNYGFNSFAFFDGKYLGAKSSGIYELAGEFDSGDQIDAMVRTSLSDFLVTQKKRIPNVYLGAKSNGTLALRTITDNLAETDALTLIARIEEIGTQKIKVGRGLKSRYWAFEISNVDGSSMNIDQIELEPEVVTRKR